MVVNTKKKPRNQNPNVKKKPRNQNPNIKNSIFVNECNWNNEKICRDRKENTFNKGNQI